MNDEILIYIEASKIAMQNDQFVGDDNNLYVTLQQLERVIKKRQDERK